MKHKIAVLAGDGIGPELMAQTLRVLDTISSKSNHSFTYLAADIGGSAFSKHGNHCPKQTLELCQEADAILFGSIGGPIDQQHIEKWKNCEVNSILKLRKTFNFSINIRPTQILPGIQSCSPLKEAIIQEGVDIVVFRELSGGLYFGRHEIIQNEDNPQAYDECRYDTNQIKAIAHAAFQTAQKRDKKVCSIDKANVLATSKLWRNTLNLVGQGYPDVELSHMLVDNCVMQLVINPQQFDVIVTENLFGDIISDLAAALPGSLGLIPSASLNANAFGLYEPSGGSAHEIAGKGIANPCAQLLSAAMMLEYSFNMFDEAQLIRNAISATFAEGVATKDLTSPTITTVSTASFTDKVIDHILACSAPT